MTSPIGPIAPSTQPQDGTPASRLSTAKSSASNARATQAQPGEAVTLSTAAQITTQLLDAARAAPGIDATAVAQARSAIQSGSYNVAPQDLATAITAAFKETPQ